MYISEIILEVKTKRLRHGKILCEFLVKWENLDEENATWEQKSVFEGYSHLLSEASSIEDNAQLVLGAVMDFSD